MRVVTLISVQVESVPFFKYPFRSGALKYHEAWFSGSGVMFFLPFQRLLSGPTKALKAGFIIINRSDQKFNK